MTITITLTPEEESRLRLQAASRGQEAETAAHSVLIEALEWEAQDRAEAIAGIQRGRDAFAEGRFRRFSEFEAEQRAKYNLPNNEKG